MGKQAKLTVKGLAKLTAPGMYGDGGGLWLQVSSATARSWCVRYTFAGKGRQMGIGSLDLVTLAEAREIALEVRRKVLAGIDPIAERRGEKAIAAAPVKKLTTFKEAAEGFIKAHSQDWKNAKHAAQWRSTLTTYAFPILGPRPVRDITTDDVKAVLEPIWRDKTETAQRVRGRIEQILNYAAISGWRAGENPARLKGHIELLLGSPSKLKKVENQPSCHWREVADFWAALDRQTSVSSLALRFIILTASRVGEARLATWSEIDRTARVWIKPASHMKGGREHRVPLTEAALAVLDAAERLRPESDTGAGLIFPSTIKGQPLSDMTISVLLRRLNPAADGGKARWRDVVTGKPITVHGFRSTFRTWVEDATNHQTDLAEAALAHTRGSRVEAAYARGDLLEKRARLMAEWAAFVTTPTQAGANVTPIRKGSAA